MAEHLSHNLLLYNLDYKVLICRECQYAIQPSGVPSHLLRHKIYRNERQELLSSIAKVQLLEPEDVSFPPANSAPIPGLPILEGYRCMLHGCGHLCASLKRMRQHWSENHESREERDKQTFVEKAKIQTFFRGTKIRYFEVQSASAREMGTAYNRPIQGVDHEDIEGEQRDHHQAMQDVDMTVSSSSSASFNPPYDIQLNQGLPLVDLETLNYFHHFNTRTSSTIPVPKDTEGSISNWQGDILRSALERRWLMCGLLSISACHMGVLETDSMKKHLHFERAANLLREFDLFWETVENADSSEIMRSGEDGAVCKAGRHVNWFLRFVRSILHDNQSIDEVELDALHTSPMLYFVATIRQQSNSIISTHRSTVNNFDNNSNNTLGVNSLTISTTTNSTNSTTPTLPFLMQSLQCLPSRMSESFGRPAPQNLPDVVSTFLAIEMLIQCCKMGLESDDVSAAWTSMAIWMAKVTEYFHKQMPRRHRGALVVLPYWLVLVKRAEERGCWFLEGAVQRVFADVVDGLKGENEGVRKLVERLVS